MFILKSVIGTYMILQIFLAVYSMVFLDAWKAARIKSLETPNDLFIMSRLVDILVFVSILFIILS